MQPGRYESLDIARGIALMFVLLFHAAIYNFANIDKLDFEHPPIIVVVMSFMALWGGVFILLSMVDNSVMLLRRWPNGSHLKLLAYAILAGILFFVCHYLLIGALGRWNIDFVNNRPDLTIVAGSLRSMRLTLPPLRSWFEGSPLSSIAANLIVITGFLCAVLKYGRPASDKRNAIILGTAAAVIMLGSFVRVPLYHLYTDALDARSYARATVFAVTLANPYPLLPYLAYGLFGTLLGILLYHHSYALLGKLVAPCGAVFLVYGAWGMARFPKTISKPDYFWYFKSQAELGIFLLLAVFVLLVLEPRAAHWRKVAVLKWLSRISLSIYMMETAVSEIARKVGLAIAPSWNQTIEGCLLFGACNVGLWVLIVCLWRKVNFKYSLEYFWVALFARIGKHSTKLVDLPRFEASSPPP